MREAIWLPLAHEALDREGLLLDAQVSMGVGGTYPAVIAGELVVKFFGFEGEWRATWQNERLAQNRLGEQRTLLVPRLIAAGELFPDRVDSWPYLILTRILGSSWSEANLSWCDRLEVAWGLGEQLRRVHALPVDGMPAIDAWQTRTPGEGARSGAFPGALAGQVDAWIESVPIGSPRFVHSDLFDRHPMIEHGRLSGIIDWGDAMAADPHVELGKLHLDVFEGEKPLLRSFLEGYGWKYDADFPRRALAMALRRHTQILGQHGEGGDMFYRLPTLIGDRRVESLDDLAELLFGL